ncbi:MAG: DUF1330 domain-containing protein [Paracoccaceae bacterium]
MPKGYWIAHANVHEPDGYGRYIETARAAFEAHGARFIARGGTHEEVENGIGRARHVLIEFPSYQAALDCFRSEAYQAARAHRLPAGEVSITIVEGLE